VKHPVDQAPCGFGKTSLLVEACHREEERGAKVVWVRCQDGLSVETLWHGLAQAFAVEGSEDASPEQRTADLPRNPMPHIRLGLLAGAIQAHAERCVIALDEAERVTDAGVGAFVNALLRHGPSNLHWAVALRRNNCGLDTASLVVSGQGLMLDAEDLRFSDTETTAFLCDSLSPKEVVRAAWETEGWPAALRLLRSQVRNGPAPSVPADFPERREVMERFLGERLMRDLEPGCRSFLLDLALLESVDPRILEEAFGRERKLHWENLKSSLHGLIRPADAAGHSYRLHPLIRKFLSNRLQAEDPGRFRQANRRLAEAVARAGGRAADALLHAAQANDPKLCGELLLEQGGPALLVTDGLGPFLKKARHLTSQIVEDNPRLAPMRCLSLLLENRRKEAIAVFWDYLQWSATLEPDSATPKARLVQAESHLLQLRVLEVAGRPVEPAQLNRLLGEAVRVADADWLLPSHRGTALVMLANHASERARFQLSQRRAAMAKDFFLVAGSRFGVGVADLLNGINAMAQGRVSAAAGQYSASSLDKFAEPLAMELAIERNAKHPAKSWCGQARNEPGEVPDWFNVRAAAQGNRAEALFEREGPMAAADFLADSIDWAARAKLVREQRLLSAQRVSWLVAAGKAGAAKRAWDEASLPDGVADLLDLSQQSWREMEAIGCARIALLGVLGRFDEARLIARNLKSTSIGLGLKRTLMRCLATWAALERRASNPVDALARLHEYLEAYRGTDYLRPLAREGKAGLGLLRSLLESKPESGIRQLAWQLLQELDGGGATAAVSPDSGRPFTEKDIEILKGLGQGRRNKDIARKLGLTESGVRYHLKRLYRTLGAESRLHAARRARELGLLPAPAILDGPEG